MELLTPIQVWQDFDPNAGELNLVQESENKYTFIAKHCESGVIKVQLNVFKPEFDSQKVLLLVKDYKSRYDKEVVDDLVKKGYILFVPDYTGSEEDTLTEFCKEYSYAKFKGEKNKPKSAKERKEYCYSLIIRRTITAINQCFNKKEIVLIGDGRGVDIAMQVAGMENRILSLVCTNGISYREFRHINKFDVHELEMNDEIMMKLTGVSGMAYAKYITIPTLFAIGSNSHYSDIDRVFNIMGEINTDKKRVLISPRSVDSVDYQSYCTILNWLNSVFVYSMPPEMPVLNVKVNSEGIIYATVKADAINLIDSVNVYYSYDNFDHTTRNWKEVKCVSIAKDEFLAKIEVPHLVSSLFSFAQVTYANKTVSSSFIDFQEIEEEEVKSINRVDSPIVFQHSLKIGAVIEQVPQAINFAPTLKEVTIPIGLKGVKSERGKLITFDISEKVDIIDSKILQLDIYSAKLEYEISVSLIECGKTRKEYIAVRRMVNSEAFASLKLEVDDFRDEDMMPLSSWEDVKCIIINTHNIVLNKILFI